MKTEVAAVSKEDIARRAYEIWQSRGCPPGDGGDDWRAAEAELAPHGAASNGATRDSGQTWWARMRLRITGRDC